MKLEVDLSFEGSYLLVLDLKKKKTLFGYMRLIRKHNRGHSEALSYPAIFGVCLPYWLKSENLPFVGLQNSLL